MDASYLVPGRHLFPLSTLLALHDQPRPVRRFLFLSTTYKISFFQLSDALSYRSIVPRDVRDELEQRLPPPIVYTCAGFLTQFCCKDQRVFCCLGF
jgi:hypothetical protein